VDLVGAVGVIAQIFNENFAVAFDDVTNHRSQYGYFYFESNQLKKLTKGDNETMDNNVKIDGNYRVAHVKFIEGTNTQQTYAYACYDDSICEGDICVVKSANHGFGIATVMDIIPKTDREMTREIVCKADFTAYNNRVENRKQRAKIKDEMAKRAESLREVSLFEMLAKTDPEMKAMLDAYKELCNGN
jgi:hypothetical protein